jgi:hypothetical protein
MGTRSPVARTDVSPVESVVYRGATDRLDPEVFEGDRHFSGKQGFPFLKRVL